MIKKIRYIIEIFVFTLQVIIYTNYSIITNIVKQTKLLFNNIDKLNFQFVKISIYLFQFRLNVEHEFNKQYIVSNVLFKLFSIVDNVTKVLNSNQSKNIFDIIYYMFLIKMFENFKIKLMNVYRKNKR